MGYQYQGNKPGWGEPQKPARKPRQLQPCGTPAAYQRHHRNKEIPCEACLDANNEYLAKRRGGKTHNRRRQVEAQCGTYAGYMKHRRNRTEMCVPCKAAYAEYKREYRARRKSNERKAA